MTNKGGLENNLQGKMIMIIENSGGRNEYHGMLIVFAVFIFLMLIK